MMKKISCIVTVLVTALLLSILTACGGGSAPAPPMAASGSSANSAQQPGGGSSSYETQDAGYYDRETGESAPTESTLPADRKIIRNAWLDIEAKDSSALYDSLTAYCTQLGGYEFSYSVSNHGGYSVINAVLKLPPEKLSTFIKFAGESGKLINSRMSSEDITDSYYDAQIRLDTKRKSLEKYYELLKDARNVDEIIQIQRTIDGITLEIESLEGMLKLWNSQVDMATVELYLRQETDPIKIKKEISWNTLSVDDMGYLIKSGLVTVLNTMASLLQWLAVALLVASPLIVIAAVVLLIILFIRKRHRAKAASEKKADDDSQ